MALSSRGVQQRPRPRIQFTCSAAEAVDSVRSGLRPRMCRPRPKRVEEVGDAEGHIAWQKRAANADNGSHRPQVRPQVRRGRNRATPPHTHPPQPPTVGPLVGLGCLRVTGVVHAWTAA